jgi:hypothetical protein
MDGDRSLSEMLPLFDTNNCKEIRDAAGQLFCGDPELNAASARLSSAIQDRMNRLPDRRLAVEIQAAAFSGSKMSGPRVSRVFEINSEIAEQSALVTAEVEMIVLSPFALCSPIASSCTGMCWDVKPGQAKPASAIREGFSVARKLRVEKAFAFQKTGNGWRCNTPALQPVDFGVALSGP